MRQMGAILDEIAVRCEYPMVGNRVHPGLGHQCGESGDEIQWFEQEVRGAVGIEAFQGVAQFAFMGDREPLQGQRWSCDIAA